jgi:hypothetical protein
MGAAQGRFVDDSTLLQLPMLTHRAVDELASVGIECIPELVAAAPALVRRTLSRSLAGAVMESLLVVRVRSRVWPWTGGADAVHSSDAAPVAID